MAANSRSSFVWACDLQLLTIAFIKSFRSQVASPPIPMCFGVVRGSDGAMVPNTALGVQPPWNTDSGRTVLSIANLIRYGACYEDDEGALLVVNQRSIAHFRDPQQGGSGIATGPSSPDWMLSGISATISGVNR